MGKTALITGASRGIGKAIACTFAKAGYQLYLTCNQSMDKLTAYAAELEQEYHITCKCYGFDIGNEAEVVKMFQEIGELDAVINNAGISYVGLLTDMTWEMWQQVINTNLGGCFLICRNAIPKLLRHKSGKIINISSVWGNVGASMEVAYSASKGGVNAFTRALAKELGPSNIQVNAIACGMIDTQMNQCFSKEELDALIEEIPADRIGKPEEVAHLALQLCEGNEYLTGQVITLDGGWIS